MCLVEKVDAIGECECEAAGTVSFTVTIAQVACFGDEFVEWFDGRHALLIINQARKSRVKTLAGVRFVPRCSIDEPLLVLEDAFKPNSVWDGDTVARGVIAGDFIATLTGGARVFSCATSNSEPDCV